GYFWLFLASQLFLFHCNYLIWAGVCAGIALHFFLCSFDKKRLESLAFLAVYAVMFHLPWMLMFSKKSAGDISGPENYLKNLRNFLIGFNNNLVPLALVLLFVAAASIRRKKLFPLAGRDLKYSLPVNRGALIVILLAANLALSALSTGYFFRYLVGVIPAAVCLNAVMVLALFDAQKVLGAAAGILLVTTNLLSYPIEANFRLTVWDRKPGLRSMLAGYGYELTHEYRGPIRGIVEYLRRESRPGQRVAIAYGEAPLMYYLPELRIFGALAGENWAAESIEKADWIIPRQYTMVSMKAFNEYLAARVNMAEYDKIEIDYPDYTFENIPEPEMHLFRTAGDRRKVMILRRKDGLTA
ncbi:MAG: hypothetical protein HY714_03420, partial [Candidatus Omnitrophica bacterium]|nr:hypothetical protein [Candidatus Omnitrophota bacterium]